MTHGARPPETVSSECTSVARRMLPCIDLTSLNDEDSPASVRALCAAARTPHGSPAAVCVNPELAAIARETLDTLGLHGVAVATVANFPDGSADAARAERETRRALAAGADEVDLVFPYRALLDGDAAAGAALLARCRAVRDGRFVLKVILETSVLREPALIRRASGIAIDAGADLIKTSTGKVATGASPEAAAVMLETIRERGGRCGFKAAGGIRTLAAAAAYVDLADRILGRDWTSPARFRIGASVLLEEIVTILDGARVS